MKTSTGDALRLILATVLLWLAEVVWDLSDWLQGVSRRLERPLGRSPRGAVRLGVVLAVMATVALMSVPVLVLGAARGAGYEPPNPTELAQRADQLHAESTGEVLYWVVRGCAEGGGRWVQGIEDGVLVGHCTPAALPHLGVMPPPPATRSQNRSPATASTRAPEERGSVNPVRGERNRAGASAGRAGAGIATTGGIE